LRFLARERQLNNFLSRGFLLRSKRKALSHEPANICMLGFIRNLGSNKPMSFYHLFYPRQTCLLVASYEGKPNVTTVDWHMPVSAKPPMIAIALNNNSHSLELISHSKEFTLAVLPENMKEMAAQIGSTSGRVIDKIDEYKIALEKGRKVETPIIKQNIGAAECKVVQISYAGDHSIIVGEVVDMHYPDEDSETTPCLYNWGSKTFFGLVRPQPKDNSKEQKKPAPSEGAKEIKGNGTN